jgi:hypothetical protein
MNSKENIAFAWLSLIVEILKHSNWPFQTHWIFLHKVAIAMGDSKGEDASNHCEEFLSVN